MDTNKMTPKQVAELAEQNDAQESALSALCTATDELAQIHRALGIMIESLKGIANPDAINQIQRARSFIDGANEVLAVDDDEVRS